MCMALPLECAGDRRRDQGTCSDERYSHLFLSFGEGRKCRGGDPTALKKFQVICVTAASRLSQTSWPCERADVRLGWCHVPEGQSGAYADLVGHSDRGHPWRGHAPCSSGHRRMKLFRVPLIMSALLLGAGGCSAYDPPVEGDHTSEKYQADVERCRPTSTETVRLKNAATPGKWIISPITGPPAVRAAIRTCMESKGYALQKTAD